VHWVGFDMTSLRPAEYAVTGLRGDGHRLSATVAVVIPGTKTPDVLLASPMWMRAVLGASFRAHAASTYTPRLGRLRVAVAGRLHRLRRERWPLTDKTT
jgi:hypothetical protein